MTLALHFRQDHREIEIRVDIYFDKFLEFSPKIPKDNVRRLNCKSSGSYGNPSQNGDHYIIQTPKFAVKLRPDQSPLLLQPSNLWLIFRYFTIVLFHILNL